MMCRKCSVGSGIVLLVIGILFLLRDLGVWGFWGIEWWTAAFILAGVGWIGCSSCAECGSCCAPAKKK